MARMGGQVQVAQCVGRGDKEKAHGYAQAAVQLATVMGLVYALVVLIFTKQMIGFFKLEDPEAYAAAFVYTKIACGLIVFSFLSVTLTGIYTAQGDSKTPFYANLIGLATNMILDPLLILGPGPLPKLGAAGGAIATVTAQFIVMSIMILGIVKQKKENVLKGITLFAKIPAEYLNGICKIGIPTAIQGMAYCVISMVITRMVSAFGAEAIATQRVGGQIESISWNTADGFGAALNAFIAQNYGAGRIDRVKEGVKKATLITWGWSVIVIAATWLFTPFFAHLITGISDPEIVGTVEKYMKINTAFYFILGIVIVFRNALQGVGDKITPIASSIIELLGKFAVAMILAPRMGYFGIMISEPLVWAGMAVMLGIGFAANKTFRKENIPNTAEQM